MKLSAYLYLELKFRMDAAIPPPTRAYMFCVQGQLYIYVQEMERYAMHIYLKKKNPAHTVLGWNWDVSLSVQNDKLANYCNANRQHEPVLKKLLVQDIS